MSPISKLCTNTLHLDLAPHEGRNLSQWVARMLLIRWGALSKNLAQRGTHGRENVRMPWRVREVRCLAVIFTRSEQAVSCTVSSTGGAALPERLKRGGKPPPPSGCNGATPG